jgi:hypothetical protein
MTAVPLRLSVKDRPGAGPWIRSALGEVSAGPAKLADPAGLPAQHRVLVPKYQEFGVLGHLTPGQHHQTTEQTANEQVDDRKDHLAMIPTRLAAQARSSNRAPQGCSCNPGTQR